MRAKGAASIGRDVSAARASVVREIDCKCCVTQYGPPSGHYFQTTACQSEEGIEQSPLISSVHTPSREGFAAPTLLISSEEHGAIHDFFAGGLSPLRSEEPPTMSAVRLLLTDECGLNESCRRNLPAGGAGPHTTEVFHTELSLNTPCTSQEHNTCSGEEEGQEMFEAFELGDYQRLAEFYLDNEQRVILNTERQMMQLVACGSIVAQTVVDFDQLKNAIQHGRAKWSSSFVGYLKSITG